jgi:hypothetical protein
LARERTPHNDNIVSFMGNEGVEIRSDKPRPVTLTGNCRALLSQIDAFRRLVDSDHQASGTNQLGDPERYVANAASKLENTHATLYDGPMDVLGQV